MSLFNEETEEEKTYKNLLKVIKTSSYLDYDNTEFFSNLVDDVRSKKINNPFFEIDFFERVILELMNSYNSEHTLREGYEEIIKLVKFLLPMGKETEDYISLKELIISKCGNIDSLFSDNFNQSFFALFDNRLDYMQLINLIDKKCKENGNVEQKQNIYDFAFAVAPYCINKDVLKSEIISYIEGLDGVLGSIESYTKDRISLAQKRCGIYAIDEKTLAIISAEVEKAQGLIEKLEILEKRVNSYKETIDTKTTSGIDMLQGAVVEGRKEIKNTSDSAVKSLEEEIEKARLNIVKRLDEYLLTLEETMKKNSDLVFAEVLKNAQDKIREVRDIALQLSQGTTSELLKIQSATEESVRKLKNYVETDPKLQEYLKSSLNSEEIKTLLLQVKNSSVSDENMTPVGEKASQGSGILVPGYERVIMPANPSIVIPDRDFKTNILPAFDERIPFKKRMDKVLDEMYRRTKEGEIFHEMTEEVVRSLIEADWPYLYGPSGCGKTKLCYQAASLVGLELIESGKITDKYSLVGYNDPHGRFRVTQSFIAFAYGKCLLFDELDNDNPDIHVLIGQLYSTLLDSLENPEAPKYMTFGEDMVVPVNPNFRMIATGNTTGEGENQVYSSRSQMDEAVQERYTPVEFNYDNRIEHQILGNAEGWYDFFIKFRLACSAYAKKCGFDAPRGITTTRDATAIAKYIRHNSKSVDQILREKFVQTKRQDYLEFLMKKMQEYYEFERNVDTKVEEELINVPAKKLAKRFNYVCKKKIEAGGR